MQPFISLVGSTPDKRAVLYDDMERMKVNDVEEKPLAMCENQAETTFTSAGQPGAGGAGGHVNMMGTWINIESPSIESVGSTSEQGAEDDHAAAPTTLVIEEGASRAAYSQRYKDVMDALSKPLSSYALLYVAPSPKTPPKKETKKSTHKIRTEKIPTKKAAEHKSFPQNVRTLTATGILDGVEVRYRSASSKKELRGLIKGTSYLCGCTSCNFSKEVTALEFESHADFKTSHPNNHIHLENGKSLHQVVQELKNTARSMLCDAIQTVIGASLNREAFSSWKESFEATSEKWKKVDEYESNTQDNNSLSQMQL